MQQQLLDGIKAGRVPHAILLSGPEGSGKGELARRCAALYCLEEDAPERLTACPNYYEIGEGTVKVDDIRTLLSSAAMQGFNGGRRAFVFLNAQNMSVQIQNTLLKTLEEPNSDTLLVLTGNEFGLLPTIRSRCVIVRLGAGNIQETARKLASEGMEQHEARFFATLGDGIFSRALEYAKPEKLKFRDDALKILEQAIFDYAPFSDAAALITVSGGEPEEETNDDEAKPKGGKKKKRGDAQSAIALISVYISLFHDAMTHSLGGAEMRNSDYLSLIERIDSRFTTAQIQGIIEMLGESQQKLIAGASVYLTLDSVLAKLYFNKPEKK